MNTETLKSEQIISSFTDVLYLSETGEVAPEVKWFFKQRKLSFVNICVTDFVSIRDRLDLIGTAIIDMSQLSEKEHQKLSRIIEALEMKNIGVILINGRVPQKVKSFSVAGPQVRSFALSDTMETVSLDELWMRISVNLAYRKRSSGIVVKPAVPPKQMQIGSSNKLAQQMRMTESVMENLSQQLSMAGVVQRDFLPSELPNSESFQWSATFLPAEWVSGDIYDVVRLDKNNIGFYVADAVGHSMPAALLTIFLKQVLDMKETAGPDHRILSPQEVMTTLNRRMSAQKLSGYQFATCCYCLLNTRSRELTFARAGHPYPILLRKGQEPRQLQIRGALLGVFERSEFEGGSIKLQSGDKVLLYSDGAEPFIGHFDDEKGFRFTERFRHMSELGVVEMLDEFNSVAQNTRVAPDEVDDITIVGLEVS